MVGVVHDREPDAREREAAERGLQYVGLDGDVGLIANGAATRAATTRRARARGSEAGTAKTTAIAAKTIPSPQAIVAEVLRTPTARAAIAPGASTSPVAIASRASRRTELIARSA